MNAKFYIQETILVCNFFLKFMSLKDDFFYTYIYIYIYINRFQIDDFKRK